MIWYGMAWNDIERYCFCYLLSFRAATATVTVSHPPKFLKKISGPLTGEIPNPKIIAETANLDWITFESVEVVFSLCIVFAREV